MNARILIAAGSLALSAGAQEKPAQFDASATLNRWATPKWDVPVEQRFPPLKLGKSDFTVTGPLIDTFRLQPRLDEERTLGRKFLDLPIINIFVPEPWPKPSRQGKYFAWGERDLPWSSIAERPRAGPSGVLVSASR